METVYRSWFFLSLPIAFFFFISSDNSLSTAEETISLGSALSGDQTISSEGGVFELGFFKPGESQNYYIGIWHKQLSNQTVVWVANRETPISDKHSSQLRIFEDGNLVLLDHLGREVWSTNASSMAANSTVAKLLDTGNLVLRNGSNSSAVIWQSFDYPPDTVLPGGWLWRNKITGERRRLTAWRTHEDPASGLFSLEMDQNGTDQLLLIWNGSQVYWRSGVWNGQSFEAIPEMSNDFNLQSQKFSFVKTKEKDYITYTLKQSLFIRSFVGSSGRFTQSLWLESSRKWMDYWFQPIIQCEVYSRCGTFGVCTEKEPFCSCPHGFEPRSMTDWDLSIWSGGCRRKAHLECGNNSSAVGEKDGFLTMHNMRLPVNRQSSPVKSFEECELSCLRNCSCASYSYNDGCSFWTGDLINLQQFSDGEGEELYLRLAASELKVPGQKKTTATWAIIGSVVGSVLILGCITVLVFRRHSGKQMVSLKVGDGFLVSFSYRDLQIMTKNFSEILGGGSFDSVFKGSLLDSTSIAVKKLEGYRQGEKQFRTETRTIGAVQHVNLVRLHGFCSQGTHRLLVYEHMHNGSLDSHLFHNSSKTLEWNVRYQIALGAARGLAYLHEQCRDCIIHCDIKPENVLLDATFCPKVADFGLARLVGREFSRVLTSIRGTIGYLAPEWISGVLITPKADIYSYGMMLFEIISGRRNVETLEDGGSTFFPYWAAKKVSDGEALSLLDHRHWKRGGRRFSLTGLQKRYLMVRLSLYWIIDWTGMLIWKNLVEPLELLVGASKTMKAIGHEWVRLFRCWRVY